MPCSPTVLKCLVAILAVPVLKAGGNDPLAYIERHLNVRGESAEAAPFQAVVRKGTYSEGRFQAGVTWTRSQPMGLREERHWTHLGRENREVRCNNGEVTWSQSVAPQPKRPVTLTGELESQFFSEAWILTDITLPLRKALAGEWQASYVDNRKIRNRKAAWIKIEAVPAIELTYIFDLESGLILAIEMPQRFAGNLQRILAVPVGISRIEGGIIESGFDFYVDGQKFRSVRFDKSTANQVNTELSFDPPHLKEFWLRQ